MIRRLAPTRRRLARATRPSIEGLEQRLTLDASLDSTFGTAGQVTVAPPNSSSFFIAPSADAEAVAVQADGKIVVAGDAGDDGLGGGGGSDNMFYVTRLNPNGTTDATFGTDGWAEVKFANSSSVTVKGIMIRPDGRIVLAGTDSNFSFEGTTHDFLAAQLLTSGALDTTFDGDGEVTIQSGAAASAASLQADGKLLIGGTTDPTSSGGLGGGGGSNAGSDFLVMRLGTTGALDTTFGTAGKATVAFDRITDGNDSLQAMTLDPSGRILVAGSAETAGTFIQSNNDFAVARLTPTGALDTTFALGGKGTVPLAATSTEDVAHAIAVLPGGQIMLAGSTTAGAGGFGITRLGANGLLDTTFGTGGTLVVPFGSNSSAVARTLAVQPNGAVVVAGLIQSAGFLSSNGMAIARLTPGGVLDTTLDGDGQLTLHFGNDSIDGALASTVQADGKVVVAGYTRGVFDQDEFALTRLAATNTTSTPSPTPTPTPTPTTGTTAQTITLSGSPASVVFGQTFHVGAISSSGLPVMLVATNAAVAASPGGGYDVTALSGTNPIVLTATQAGNSSYSAAAPASATVPTTKAGAVVTLGGLSANYDGSAHPAIAGTTPAGLAVTLAYTANGVAVASPLNPGVYIVSATVVDPNYQGTAFGTLTITSGPTVLPLPSTVVAALGGQLTFNKHKQLTTIVIVFSGALDPASASNVANYRLATAGTKGSFDAKNARRLAIRSAHYDPATHIVMLVVKPFAVTKPVQLRIDGSPGRGVLDAAGNLIDGDRDGRAGGDSNALIRKHSVSF